MARTNLMQIIKQVAIEAIEGMKPVHYLYGTVAKAAPLQINIEQRLNLEAEDLILTDQVRDHVVEFSNGEIAKRQQMTLYRGLKVGEKVLLSRMQGGQKFIVLSRVVEE